VYRPRFAVAAASLRARRCSVAAHVPPTTQHQPQVTVEFGDRLGELLDTMTALKNLGLDIRKAKVDVAAAAAAAAGNNGTGAPRSKPSTFYITEQATSEKVLKSARLEEIRMTIIQNMLTYHPESGEVLAAGSRRAPLPTRDPTNPLGAAQRSDVQTTIAVRDADNGSCSLLHITTRDRPGLLVDIVSVLKDINVNVVSAEVDTIGDTADDELFVTYHGEPLTGPMTQLVTNALQYYLSLAEVAKEESY
jgi:UTP:GlnB (protein PII) uridylyltransferase